MEVLRDCLLAIFLFLFATDKEIWNDDYLSSYILEQEAWSEAPSKTMMDAWKEWEMNA